MKAWDRVLVLALVVTLSLLSVSLHAQTFYGSIVGSVTDITGAVIPGGAVTLTNLGTSERRTAETGADGNYQFVNLVPGRYKIDIEKPGFKHLTRDEVIVEVQSAVRIDASLQVGDVGQVLEVTGQTPLLQTESSSLSQVVEARTVQEMPLNGRNVLNLVSLVPGVVPQGNAMANAATTNNTGWGNYQIGGGMANQSAAFLDGGPLNTGYVNMIAMVPAQDAVQEFRVQTINLGPEFGRFAGGVINLSCKSGTNKFHGSAYEFLRNKLLNANTFFNNRSGISTPAFTQNQFGVTTGGPVRKDRTFFFFGYEGFRLSQGRSVLSSVPTAAMRNGDFSNLRDATGKLIPIYDPLTTCGAPGNSACATSSNGSPIYTRSVFPNNIIPPSRLDPTAVPLTGLWALPNRAGQAFTQIQNFAVNVPTINSTDQFNFRMDQNVSDKQRIFGRYSRYSFDYPASDTYGTKISSFSTALSQQAVFADTYTFSATTIGDVRIAWLRYEYNNTNQSLGTDLTKFGWPQSLISQFLFTSDPVPVVQGYNDILSGSGVSYIIDRNNSYSVAPSLTKILGRHTFKFGGEIRKLQFNFAQTNNSSGQFNFDNLFTSVNPLAPAGTGYGFASFMLGYGSSGTLVQSPVTAGEQSYQGYYFSDSFQIGKRLTLNYGVRWELPGPWTERFNRLSVLLPDAVSPLAQVTGLPLKGKLAVVDSSDWPSRYNMNFHKDLFAPRLGFAYRLTNQMVVRGGYGIFYLPNDIDFRSGPYGSPVNNTTTTWVPTLNGEITPSATLHNPFPNGVLQPPGHNPVFQSELEGQSIASPLPSDPYAYTQQWNLDVQWQSLGGTLFEVGYAGSKGTHLGPYYQNINTLPDQYLSLGPQLLQQVQNPFYGLITSGSLAGPTIPSGQLLLPFPQYTSVNQVAAADRDSVYHSLVVKVEKRLGSGGTILAAYTFSKFISNTDTLTSWLEPGGVAGGSGGDQDKNNLRLERSLSSFDVPNRLVISYVLDLPVGKGKRFLGDVAGVSNKIVSGWGIDGVSTFQSGFPLGLTTSANLTNSFGGGSRPNVVAGCNKNEPGSAQARINEWFNTGCFQQPAAFTYGSEGRTDPNLRGQGIANYDFSVFKNTAITERVGLQFRTEFFNLFNRVQFGLPNMVLGTPQFGIVGTQVNNPRLIQFALRLQF